MSDAAPCLLVTEDAGRAARTAATRVADALRAGEVLGLATGATMVPFYRALVAEIGSARLPHRGVVGLALDEYVGLPPDHPASFGAYLAKRVCAPLSLPRERVVVPDGTSADRAAAAARHEAAIAEAGGIGLQVLGLGANGHIGFNEPGSPFNSRTRDVALEPRTREAQAAAFGGLEAVPHRAITAGVATILDARRILLLVTGRAKASALAAALEGPVGPHCPASALRRHSDVTVICDAAAASRLSPILRRVAEVEPC